MSGTVPPGSPPRSAMHFGGSQPARLTPPPDGTPARATLLPRGGSFVTNRRNFLSGLAAVGACTPFRAYAAGTRREALRVNAGRLQQTLEELSVFGRPAGGSFADGVSRIAYSDADVAGRKYVMDLMRKAGLDPSVDTAGHIH